MKESIIKNNFLRKLLLNIVIANAALAIFDIQAFQNFWRYIYSFLYSFCISSSYWLTFYAFRNILDKYLPFIKYTIVRYIVDILLFGSMAIINTLLISYMFFTYVWKAEITAEYNWETIRYTLLTFGISFPIVYSIVFMLMWKKTFLETENLKQKQLELEYDSLKSQMNPHFLFNSFNSLTALIEQDKDKSIQFVKTLSNIYRYILENKNNDLVELQEEIDFANSYISLQKIRFGDNLLYDNKVSENKSFKIIPLSIQIMLENALKHNIVSNAKHLHISVYLQNNYLVVENNYQPKNQETSGKGIGHKNISALCKSITGLELSIEKTEERYVVKIPLLKNI